METIGIRELRQNASRYLRRVASGETIEITDRGHPVARLIPVLRSRVDQLVADGRMTAASGSVDDLPPPLPAKPDGPTLSEILREMREGER